MAQPGTIESVMTPFPYSIEADAHAGTALSMLNQMHIHHLPVREGEHVIGIVSDRDLMRAKLLGQDLSPTSNLRVADICARNVYIAEPDTPIVSVLRRMADENRDVVLVTRAGQLIGIFTFIDACRRYADLLRAQATGTPRRG